ncbi:MAG TPA: hypothetical protein VKU00_04510 [Chthonomonadaceae bacterium]|nr:hypothetical protein [Chthonomonadaceae bacterium]
MTQQTGAILRREAKLIVSAVSVEFKTLGSEFLRSWLPEALLPPRRTVRRARGTDGVRLGRIRLSRLAPLLAAGMRTYPSAQ